MTELAKRIPEEASRAGREVQQKAEGTGRQFQKAGEQGFDAVLQSWSELNSGWASLAAEVTNYSQNSLEDATRVWERAFSAKTFGEVVEVQAQYAKKAYDDHIARAARLRQMYVRLWETALKPIMESTKRE